MNRRKLLYGFALATILPAFVGCQIVPQFIINCITGADDYEIDLSPPEDDHDRLKKEENARQFERFRRDDEVNRQRRPPVP